MSTQKMANTLFPDTTAPKTAVLEMTYRCNHRCLFCSVPWESPRNDYEKLRELNVDEWMECLDILIGAGVRTIAISGGEPLLKEGLEDIVAYAKRKRVREPVFGDSGCVIGYGEKAPDISVITNGELIDRRWVDFFARSGAIMTVSLPGMDAFHDLTGGGDHRKALSAIYDLSHAGINVVASVCVTKRNLSELFETISHAFLSGAKQLLLNRFLPGGRGLRHMDLCLDRDDIAMMLDVAEEVCREANTYGSVGTELPKCVLEKEYTMLNVGTLCSGGVDFFAVDPSGKVRPCNHSPVRCGDFRDLPSAIGTPYWQRFKCKEFLPGECAACSLSLGCDGGCREAAHIVGGSLSSRDPVFSGNPLKCHVSPRPTACPVSRLLPRCAARPAPSGTPPRG